MTSLRKYGDQLAEYLGSTPAAIYERQRLAVRIGLIELAGSRGPGGGTPATAESVAVMVICFVCANGPEPEEHSLEIAKAKPTAKSNLVAARCFADALARVLGSVDLASHTREVRISQLNAEASILFDHAPPLIFRGAKFSALAVQFDVKLSGSLIQKIAQDLSPSGLTKTTRRSK